jgi:hypothetical protein
MKLYHGIQHYAVTGRRVDWKPLKGVEIFASRNMGAPIVTITGARAKLMVRRLSEITERHAMQSYLESVIEAPKKGT